MHQNGEAEHANGSSKRTTEWPPAAGGKQTALDAPFAYWIECEKVAMHFNEVTLSFRLKALGSLAIGGGLLGGFISKKEGPLSLGDWQVLAAVTMLTLAVWFSVALLDTRYYIPLLSGAVDEIKRIEEKYPQMQLSTSIERSVQRAGYGPTQNRPRRLVRLMYVLPGACLILFELVALRNCGALAAVLRWAANY